MDILAIWTTIIVVAFLDWVALKYGGSVLIFLMAGIIAIFGLAGIADDNSIDSWHFLNSSGVIVNDFWTPTSDSHSFFTMLAILAILGIVNFTMAIVKQLGEGADKKP